MGEVAEVVATDNTSREAVGADGGGADPVWGWTVEG